MADDVVGKCFCGGSLHFRTGPNGESRGVCDRCHTFRDLRQDANCEYCGRAKAEHPIADVPSKIRKGRKTKPVKGCNCDYGFDNRPATPLPFTLRELTDEDKQELQVYLRR